MTTFDEEKHGGALPVAGPDSMLLQEEDRQLLHQALAELAPEFREVIVMRDIEGLSYKEIASAADVPIGTVMSRLARARGKLARSLKERLAKEQ